MGLLVFLNHSINQKQTPGNHIVFATHHQKMKTRALTLLALMIFSLSKASLAQSIVCGAFSITAITPDTVNTNTYQVSIHSMTAPTYMVNYPHVAAILDCNADTVATGGLIYFGQPGQTTLDYPVTVSGSLSCQPLTAVFIYGLDGGSIDTCLLYFNTTGLNTAPDKDERLFVYPNPTTGCFNMEVSRLEIGQHYYIHDALGKIVSDGVIGSTLNRIAVDHLSVGIYRISVGSDRSVLLIKE